jgi:hypothetical protein
MQAGFSGKKSGTTIGEEPGASPLKEPSANSMRQQQGLSTAAAMGPSAVSNESLPVKNNRILAECLEIVQDFNQAVERDAHHVADTQSRENVGDP